MTAPAYIGRKSCGCIVAACMDAPEYAEDNAEEIASWIRDGLTVERMDVAQVRISLSACHCGERECDAPQTVMECPS